jgi:hypothetical protein
MPGGKTDWLRFGKLVSSIKFLGSQVLFFAFFESHIGPQFHFTYRMNQYRLTHSGLTYGDLVVVWLKEWNRRRNPNYEAPIAQHGKYKPIHSRVLCG